MNFGPLNCKTHYSLLRSTVTPKKLIEKCQEYGYQACGIADYSSLAGAVEFYKECQKNNIKPVIGCEFFLQNSQKNKLKTTTLLAKNKKGFQTLLELVSNANDNPLFDKSIDRYYPVIKLGDECLLDNKKNLIELNNQKYNPHYLDQKQRTIYEILLSCGFKSQLHNLHKSIENSKYENQEQYLGLNRQFPQKENFDKKSQRYLTAICDSIEDFSLTSNPKLPKFQCPDKLSSKQYLQQLCQDALSRISVTNIDTYRKRLEKELKIIFEFHLEDYFLIIQDLVNWIKQQNYLVGLARGSAAGCLVSYLLNITGIDPIEYGLIFERFLNKGRFGKDKVELPDIDIDIPTNAREPVIDYIKDKYGHDKVCQMATYGEMQGRASLKEVLRAYQPCSFEMMNRITREIPQKDKISDKMEADNEKSIIRWILKNRPKKVKDYCRLEKHNNLVGDYRFYFEKAIDLEGIYRSQSKHPAAVLLSPENLAKTLPLVYDKHGLEKISSYNMYSAEDAGLVKIDVLGVSVLNKLMDIGKLINER